MAAHKGHASSRSRCTRGGSSVAAIPVYQSPSLPIYPHNRGAYLICTDILIGGRDSSGGILTRGRDGRQKSCSLIPGNGEEFVCTPKRPPILQHIQPTTPCVSCALALGTNYINITSSHSPPSIAEVNE
jgi:hypothetical protein